MPWPIRFGPEPRISTFGRSDGRDLGLLVVAWSSGTASWRRTRPRTCRRSCRPGAAPSRCRSARTPSSPASSGRSAATCRSDRPARLARRSSGSSSTGARHDLGAQVDQRRDLVDEPRVDTPLAAAHLGHARAQPQRPLDRVEPAVVRRPQRLQRGSTSTPAGSGAVQNPAALVSIERIALLSASVKLRPERHRLADRLHRRGQLRVGAGNFSNANRGIFTTT